MSETEVVIEQNQEQKEGRLLIATGNLNKQSRKPAERKRTSGILLLTLEEIPQIQDSLIIAGLSHSSLLVHIMTRAATALGLESAEVELKRIGMHNMVNQRTGGLMLTVIGVLGTGEKV